MKLYFKEENLMSIQREMEGLIFSHRDEIGAFSKASFPLQPDWNTYGLLCDAELYKLYTARILDSNKLVGYMGFIVHHHLHYMTRTMADNDITFLHRDERKGLAGYKLIKYAIGELKKVEPPIDLISLSMKTQHSFGAIATRLGFVHTDQVYHMEV